MFPSSAKDVYPLGQTGHRKETVNLNKKGHAGSNEYAFTVKNQHFAFST